MIAAGQPARRGCKFCRECGAPDRAVRRPLLAPVPPAVDYGACVPEASSGGAGPSFSVRAGHTSAVLASDLQPRHRRSSANPGIARLVMLLRDGSEGRTIPLNDGDADIGSREGEIIFGDDPYLSPRHARVSCRAGAYTLRDLDSANGVYVRLRDVQELHDRDMVLLGQQVLRFELLLDGELPLGTSMAGGVLVFGTPEVSRFARLVQYTTEGVGRDVHYLFRDETVIGRENGDIVFTDDPFLSRRHAAIRIDHAGTASPCTTWGLLMEPRFAFGESTC